MSQDWITPIAPTANAETQPFWDACQHRTLLIQRCASCEKYQYHYRAFCCHCWIGHPEDVVATGHGTVWSYTVIHRNRTPGFLERVPYIVARVELDEGVRMLTRLIDCSPDHVRIGMEVTVDFAEAPGGWLIPVFRPM